MRYKLEVREGEWVDGIICNWKGCQYHLIPGITNHGSLVVIGVKHYCSTSCQQLDEAYERSRNLQTSSD